MFPIYTIWIAATFLLTGTEGFSWPGLNLRTTVVLAVIVVLTPLQCAAEEYVFRGLAQQTLGTWLKSPAWGILVPVPFFMIGHEYGWLGQIDIAVFAICMGLLVWKSGGLELAIVLHTANNLNLFLLSPFNPSILGQGDVEPLQLLMSATLTVVMTAAAWMWLSRTDTRRGLILMEPRINRKRRLTRRRLRSRRRSAHERVSPTSRRWRREREGGQLSICSAKGTPT